MKTHTFTSECFRLYKERVEHWLHKFGLTEWSVEGTQMQIGGGVNAQVQYNHVRRHAIFRLTENTEGDYGLTTDPDRLALHEVLHLLVASLVETTAARQSAYDDLVVAEEHAFINRVMRVL